MILKTNQYEEIEEVVNNLFPNRKINSVLLIQPPDASPELFDFNTAKSGRYWNFPAYGLGLLATKLREIGIEVDIINLNHSILKESAHTPSAKLFDYTKTWQNTLKERIAEMKPDLIGVSAMFTQTHSSMVSVCKFIKVEFPQAVIAMGGVHTTNSLADKETRKGFLDETYGLSDIFFLYESDISIRKFILYVNKDTTSDKLYQIILRSKSDEIDLSTRNSPLQEQINTIPAYDLMDTSELSKYGKIGSFYSINPKDTKYSTVLANRGCRAKCTFCSVSNFNGRGVRHKNSQTIIEELKILKYEYDIKHIMWLDDDFFHDKKEKIHLFNEMVKLNLNMTWDCTNGVLASSCTEDIVSAAESSGCTGINIGVESGNPSILKIIKKPGTVETFLAASEVFKKYQGINTRVFLMIGFPYETYQMIEDTYQLAMDMDLDWYNITIYEPLPNTNMFDDMISDGLIKKYKSEDVRYNAGPYGKTREGVRNDHFSTTQQNSIFSDKPSEEVPTRDELDNIWFSLNYELNFKRLDKDFSKAKLEQQYRYMNNVANLVAPDDAFAIYFGIYMNYRYSGKVDKVMFERLKQRLDNSAYWRSRFKEFDLDLADISTDKFQSFLFY